MKRDFFQQHLREINDWWEDLVDWEGGGIFVYTEKFSKQRASDRKECLMHARQLYNYCVGHEHGHPNGERIARHLYQTLDVVFTEWVGELFVEAKQREERVWGGGGYVNGYVNAYVVIALSRFARTFRDREAAERALRVYRELDVHFTDPPLFLHGSWMEWGPETGEKRWKSDNSIIHRCEAALNLHRALEAAAPEMLETFREYLTQQFEEMTQFFDRSISRPEEGYTVERMESDGTPHRHDEWNRQSLAHGFEWMGFCFEMEAHCGMDFDFLETRGRQLAENTLRNGLASNGCFRNDYIHACRDGGMYASFWPQVEAPLGVLWARKRWGEAAFPLEKAERMLGFYQQYFFKDEALGGGILNMVSENGVPMRMHTGFNFKCDHHAVRLCEKVLEYELI